MGLIALTAAAATILVAFYLSQIAKSYSEARKTGFPIIVTPINPQWLLWVILGVPLMDSLRPWFPEALILPLDAATWGFEVRAKNTMHKRLGATFALAGPGVVQIWTSDPATAKAVTQHWRAFPAETMLVKMLSLFGPNVLASNGSSWQRQRRIVAPLINERIMPAVWRESWRQARQMGDAYAAEKGPVTRLVEGTARIAINVLGAVAYGKPRAWSDAAEPIPAGRRLGYIDGLRAIASNIGAAVMLPKRLVKSTLMPREVRDIGFAVDEFPLYTADLLAAERAGKSDGQSSLLAALVRASDETMHANADAKAASRLHLSEEELTGNLFLFTIAGFSTTASAMGFAFALLATRPDVQEWLVEEVDEVLPVAGDDEDAPAYEDVFPKLKRVHALLYEVVRTHAPIPHIGRESPTATTLPSSSGATHAIPASAQVIVSIAMAHYSPDLFGPDELAFRPSRWIDANGELLDAARQGLLAWSAGPRVCPGAKMASVEFVAAVAAVVRCYRVSPARRVGESVEEARVRIEGVVRDTMQLESIRMKHPERLELRFERRV